MTNELEKQFFQCFGIEARQKCAKPLLKNTGGFCKAYKNCVGCDYNDLKYPQITDHILLKLICLLADLYDSNSYGYPLLSKDIKELKEDVLDDLMGAVDVENDYPEGYVNKVRALFEER